MIFSFSTFTILVLPTYNAVLGLATILESSMTDEDKHLLEPEDTGDGEALPHGKGRRAFTNLRRELTDDELSSTSVQRMLIDDIDRLEKEKFDLKEYQSRFHVSDKKASILQEQLDSSLKSSVSQEIIFGVCLTVGAAAMGYAPVVWDENKPTGELAITFGVILIIAGIVSKVVKR